jgi:hypothetical protein
MPSTRLFLAPSVEEQWHTLAGPWLRAQALTAWKNPLPTVILTPSRAEGFYLRSRMVEEKMPSLGLRFWTPTDARNFLMGELLPDREAARQAELRLVARSCAERLLAESATPNPTLASVVREPAAFLRAYDLLLGAGWDPAAEGATYGRELAREMQRSLAKWRLTTQAGAHRQLRSEALAKSDLPIAHLFVIGFDATHWPIWDLLQAAVTSASEFVVALMEPRVFGEEIDQLWISSWEEIIGTEAIIPEAPVSPGDSDERPQPFAELVASYEQGVPREAVSSDLSFLVTPDLRSQVDAVALQVLHYLQSDSCTRLGIIFPEANALALGVADKLRSLSIPLDNGTGSLAPGVFERRCWQTWIALQEEPGVRRLIAWVRACEVQGVSCGIEPVLSAREIADALQGALSDTLVDDLDFLALHFEENARGPRAAIVADFLRERIVLHKEATFGEFLSLTRQAVSLPGWEEYRAYLAIDPPSWLSKSDDLLPRRIFLEWLKESTDSQTWSSGENGNHFYGKVHLTIYAQMPGQTWSHLILTGLNEGVWPRATEDGAFGSRHEIGALNQQVRTLNRRGRGEGGQGEGHKVVRVGHGHCLLALERQDLALRDLCSALESTSHAVCLTAMTTEGGRSLLPSDFFNHAYQSKTGDVLEEDSFRGLAKATLSWCEQHSSLFENQAAPSALIEQTKIAYAARRDAASPFGPYEFAHAQPPPRPIQLRCKRWEDAWRHPATVWLQDIVGALPWPEGTLSWQQAIGTWSHRWIAAALEEWRGGDFAAMEFPVLLWSAADRQAAAIRNRAQTARMELYPWWNQVLGEAKTRSLQLAETLAPLLPEHFFLSEFKLPPDLMIALPGSPHRGFELKGRIDFLRLEEREPAGTPERPDFTGASCWVIDFKTGSSKALTSKNILKGVGLQAVLYALAARALGAATTSMSVLTPDSEATVQLNLDGRVDPLLAALEKFHREGIFGMRPDAESDYGFAPSYPIATQFVPSDILEAKWELTHHVATESEE